MGSVHLFATEKFSPFTRETKTALKHHKPDCITIEYYTADIFVRLQKVRTFLLYCLQGKEYSSDQRCFGKELIQSYLGDFATAKKFAERHEIPFYPVVTFFDEKHRNKILYKEFPPFLNEMLRNFPSFEAYSFGIFCKFLFRQKEYEEPNIVCKKDEYSELEIQANDKAAHTLCGLLSMQYARIFHLCDFYNTCDDAQHRTLYSKLCQRGVAVTRSTPIAYGRGT
jgi:hypothetical protein